MNSYFQFILIALLALTACDSAREDSDESQTFTFTVSATVTGEEERVECRIDYATLNETRRFSVVGLEGETPALPVDSARAVQALCSGQSDTGLLRAELFVDSLAVDVAETTSPMAGVVVEHGDTSSF